MQRDNFQLITQVNKSHRIIKRKIRKCNEVKDNKNNYKNIRKIKHKH